MEQRISIITLGVNDLTAMKKFYTEKFDWKIEAQAKDIAFFKLNGLLLGLYGRNDLARFLKRSPDGSGFRPFNLAYMVGTDAEVHEIFKQFVSKGIKIVQEPETPPIGGIYFLAEDIEGNVWEVARNPFMDLDASGNVLSHSNIDHL